MDVLRNLFGHLSAGIIRLLVTVGIIAAVGFFLVKPALETTRDISRETNQSIQNGFQQPGVTNIFSVASIWETAIKFALNRADFRVDPRLLRRGLLDNGYEELAITAPHALAAGSLPLLHRDPFDRIIVAQAGVEGYLLLLSVPLATQYPGPVRAV